MALFQKPAKTLQASVGAMCYIFSVQEPHPLDKGVRDSQHNNNRQNEYNPLFHHRTIQLVLGHVCMEFVDGFHFHTD
jgi:hypothetical protein